MMSKIKIVSICTLFAIFFGIMPNITREKIVDAADVENYANVVLDSEKPKLSGFSAVEPGTDETPQLAERSGEICWLMDKLQGTKKSTINFKLDKNIKPESFDGSIYDIEVDYYDSGKGYFVLYYKNTDGDMENRKIVYTNASNTWKTAKFTLSNADFKGDVNGAYDFYLSIMAAKSNAHKVSPESMAIKRVSVTRQPNVNKLYSDIKIKNVGNTFSWYDTEKIVDARIINYSGVEQNDAEITFRAITDSGVLKAEKTEKISVAAGETKELQINFGEIDYCGIYWLETETKLSDGTTFIQRPTKFAILKTDPDGIAGNLYLAEHVEKVPEEDMRDGFELMKMGNFAGIRGSVYESKAQLCREFGLDFIPIIWGLPPDILEYAWTGYGWAEMPHNEIQYAAWRKVVAEDVNLVKDITSRYEIWNEPNLPSFNPMPSVLDGAVYAETCRVAKEVIEELDPGSLVGGPGLADITLNSSNPVSGQPFFDKSIKAGIAGWTDAVSLHPYTWLVPERQTQIVDAIKYYKDEYIKNGCEDVEVWLTELGYTSADAIASTEHLHGSMIVRQQLLYKSFNIIDYSVIHSFETEPGIIATDREDRFGMVEAAHDAHKLWGTTYFPRPAYLMTTAYNYIMADTTDGKMLELEYGESGNVGYTYKSGKFNKNVFAVVNKDNVKNSASFDLGVKTVDLYDEYGNMTTLTSDDGIYTIDVGEAPAYIIGDFDEVKSVESGRLTPDTLLIKAPTGSVFGISVQAQDDEDYTLEAECAYNTELVEVKKDGRKYTARIKNNLPVGEEFEIALILKNPDGTAAARNVYSLTSSDPVSSTVDISPISDDYYVWEAVIDVKNMSSEKPLTGHIEFKKSDVLPKIKNADIGLIPAECTGEVRIRLGRFDKKGLYPVEYEVVADDGNRYYFSNTFDMSYAKYADKKPTIDGKLDSDEWSFGTAMVLDTKTSIKQITEWRGKEDLSAKMMVMWDEDNVYFGAEVSDDVHTDAPAEASQWKGDNIQIGIFYGSQGLIAQGQGSSSYHELGIAKTENGDQVWRWSAQDNSQAVGAVTEGELKVVRKGIKTYYEAKFPWKAILKEGQQPAAGDQVSFNFIVNDNDGYGRRGWMEYTPGIGETKNTQLFAKLKLLPQKE